MFFFIKSLPKNMDKQSNEPEEDPEEDESLEEDPEESIEEDPEEEPFEEANEDPPGVQVEEKETYNSSELSFLNPHSEFGAPAVTRRSSPIFPDEKISLPRSRSDENQLQKKHKQPGCIGSSQKRQCSRWETPTSEDKEMKGDCGVDWFNLNLASPDLNPEVLRLKADLLEIVQKLMKPEIHDERPQDERSPSPEPVYDNLGIRVSTREVRLRKKLLEERRHVISKLIEKDPTFKPPHDYKAPKFFKKLFIPVKEHPDFNFIGLLLGPQGNTQKKMEMETGAKISLRGKGSSRTPQKMPSENEELHVYIEADDRKSLDSAVSKVEKLINLSDESLKLKQAQLVELAELNKSKECSEQGQQHYPLPFLLSTLELAFSGRDSCSGNLIPSCSLAISSPCTISPQRTSETGVRTCQTMSGKFNKELDNSNLYIGNLPVFLIENNLKDIFSGFGKITSVKVARDRVTGIPRGYGFVGFENSTEANLAMTRMNGYELNGHILEVRIAGHPPVFESHCDSLEVSSASAQGITTVTQNTEINLANLYVCHLPISMNENRLEQLFSSFGEITGVKLMKDRFTGTSRGFGFVHFRNVSDAAEAVALMNGGEVEGHLLEVRVADQAKGSLAASSHGNLVEGSTMPGLGSTSAGTGKFNTETDAARLIIFYLPQAVNESGLLELFFRFGKITYAKVARDHSTGISKGTGFVHFESVGDAQRAVAEMNGFVIEGHQLKVEIAKPPPVTGSLPVFSPGNQLFLRCIPENVDENYLALLFSPFGKITKVQLIRDQTTGLNNGCGFICYEKASDAAMAVAHMNGFKIKGHFLEVKLAGYTQLGTTQITHNNLNRESNPGSLFVGYLPIAVDENCLMQLFSGFGKIVGVKVVRNHVTGFSKGCGFVNFEDANDAAQAMKSMNGLIFQGHMLVVKVAQDGNASDQI